MKKIITLLVLVMMACPAVSFAQSPDNELQLVRLRNEKNAKDTVINTQIKAIKIQIARVTLNESLSSDARNSKLNAYQKQILDLENQKSEINVQYKKAKKALKN